MSNCKRNVENFTFLGGYDTVGEMGWNYGGPNCPSPTECRAFSYPEEEHNLGEPMVPMCGSGTRFLKEPFLFFLPRPDLPPLIAQEESKESFVIISPRKRNPNLKLQKINCKIDEITAKGIMRGFLTDTELNEISNLKAFRAEISRDLSKLNELYSQMRR